MPPEHLIAAAVVVAAACLLQGAVGFGAGLVAAPVLVLIDPRLVPGALVPAFLLLGILMAYRDRGAIHRPDLVWGLAGRVPGTVLGAWCLTMISNENLAIGVGVVVLFGVVASAAPFEVRPAPRSLLVGGVLSGFMGTATSIGGPPLALLYQHESGDRFRGTLSAFFTAGSTMSLVALWLVGSFGADELRWAMAFLPGVVLAFSVSHKAARVLDRGYTRPAILGVCTLAGVIVIVKQVI